MAIKRFYSAVSVGPRKGSGFPILLDGKALMTPEGRAVSINSKGLAEGIAAEWQAQGAEIKPHSMPLTRHAYTVTDRVTVHRDALVGDLARYAANDLLCYRAREPEELVLAQARAFDPWIAYARAKWDVELVVTREMLHVPQLPGAMERLIARIAAQDDNRLAALVLSAQACASAVLGLAVAEGALQAKDALTIAQTDEDFQIARWGLDGEAEKRRIALLADMDVIDRVLNLGGV